MEERRRWVRGEINDAQLADAEVAARVKARVAAWEQLNKKGGKEMKTAELIKRFGEARRAWYIDQWNLKKLRRANRLQRTIIRRYLTEEEGEAYLAEPCGITDLESAR